LKLFELKEKIDELIDQGFGNHTVIQSADEEGNSFGELLDLEVDMLWDGDDIYVSRLSKEKLKQGYTKEDIGTFDMEHVIIFWPTI
jgi:hypothetical protein